MRAAAVMGIAAIALASCSSPAPAEPSGDEALPVGMQSPVKPAAAAPIGPSAASIDAATAAIKAEPKVKDMLYQGNDAVQWQIGVLDDGSKRTGYALYICNLLREHEALAGRTHVRIVDIAKVNQGEDFRSASLGHVVCETGDVLNP
jgi:hypothetical protein